MIGSHIAWVFVALLLGVCIGWLTYQRARTRLLDAIIWIVVGLVVASPLLLLGLLADATPLGTLLALFYFVGCPLGWTWRHGAIVEHRCAETGARGYVFRGAATPPRWQSLSRQKETGAALAAGSVAMSAASLPAMPATAHAVPGDGRESLPCIGATTGANAAVATAPTSPVYARSDAQAPSLSNATPTKARQDSGAEAAPPPAQDTVTGSPNPAPSATGPLATVAEPNTSMPPGSVASDDPPSPVSTSSSAPSRTGAPAVASTSALDPDKKVSPEPAASASTQTVQTSLDLAPPPPTDTETGKGEPQTKPAPLAGSEPPTSAPVPGQDKHAGVRPPGIVSARENRPDELQLIRGIGPQNEGRLHGLGIWHFDQIGAWTVEEVRWVGSYLAFPGRIDRKKWVEQAREIASGAMIPKAAARRPARPR